MAVASIESRSSIGSFTIGVERAGGAERKVSSEELVER